MPIYIGKGEGSLMNDKAKEVEAKLAKLIEQHKDEWAVICGLLQVPDEDIPMILRLLRNEGLYELEAMLIWKMEQIELNRIYTDGRPKMQILQSDD